MELISREAAIEAIDAKCKRYFNSIGISDYDYEKADERSRWISDGVAMAVDAVLDMPTIDPVKHGRWVKLDLWTKPVCTVCGEPCLGLHGFSYETTDYCPNCGARMEGEEDETD